MGIEEEAEKHVDLVLQLEKDVKSLKKKLDKLTKQVEEQVAISGFQEQLNAFDKKITELGTVLLETRRFVASGDIEHRRIFLETWTATNFPLVFPKTREFLLIKAAAADEEIKHSLVPIAIAKKFHADCQIYFKKQGLPAFRE